MTFESFTSAWNLFLISGFVIALIMGAIVNKTNFCTMGAVSDAVNIGDYGRIRAWFLAIAVAMIGVIAFEAFSLVRPGDAFPPYRQGNLIWAENILGGIMFGIGMTLASGCGNKTLVRLGGGNLKSVFVLAIIGLIAFYMLNALPGTDKTLFSALFFPWIRPLAIDLGEAQDLGTVTLNLFNADIANAVMARLFIGGAIALALLVYIFRSADFRKNKDNILGGMAVGLAILAAWVATSNAIIDVDGEQMNLAGFYSEWDMSASDDDLQPAVGAPLSPQSFTFINPLGQALGFLAAGGGKAFLTFGIVAALGVIIGSFLWAVFTRSFRIEWFANFKDFATHVIGAILMGFGGVLAMGCTLGQGVTGASTLAIGSFIALASIIIGCALTMKVQYYRMVYEEEASFAKALVASLADMRLLPNSMRKLDKV